MLNREGITTPFEIQAATMPDALAGRDVLGRGQTGSGKTLAFGLPLLARVAQGGRALPHHPKALILVPTRELAMQVADALMPLGRSVGVFLKTAVGGVPYDRQMDALRRGVEVIVATPGRLGDLIERGACKLDNVEVTVLDEADQMADMGFLPEVTELLAKTPADAQRLLFSATLDGDVDTLVKRFMHDPVTHSTDSGRGERVHHGSPPAADPAARQVPDHGVDRQPGRARRSSSPVRRWASTGWSSSSPRSVSAPARCTAARPSGSAPARWRSSRKAGRTCWSPPTSPPAASTSTASRWSCTWTRRRTRRTTCTVPVARPAPASPVRS